VHLTNIRDFYDVWLGFRVSILFTANEVNKTEEEKGKAKKRTEVSYDEVVTLLKSGASRFVDVRDANERANTGSLPGSVNIPRKMCFVV
jgi:3-mercaptopyruvate sulfurtransferase SseA